MSETRNEHLEKMSLLNQGIRFDEEEGRWADTEGGHHIHLNEEGVAGKGNPSVISTMTKGTKPSQKGGANCGSKSGPKDVSKSKSNSASWLFNGMSKEKAEESVKLVMDIARRSKEFRLKKEKEYTSKLDEWAEKDTANMSVSQYVSLLYDNGGDPSNPFSETPALRKYAEKKHAKECSRLKNEIEQVKSIEKSVAEWESAVINELFSCYSSVFKNLHTELQNEWSVPEQAQEERENTMEMMQ